MGILWQQVFAAIVAALIAIALTLSTALAGPPRPRVPRQTPTEQRTPKATATPEQRTPKATATPDEHPEYWCRTGRNPGRCRPGTPAPLPSRERVR